MEAPKYKVHCRLSTNEEEVPVSEFSVRKASLPLDLFRLMCLMCQSLISMTTTTAIRDEIRAPQADHGSGRALDSISGRFPVVEAFLRNPDDNQRNTLVPLQPTGRRSLDFRPEDASVEERAVSLSRSVAAMVTNGGSDNQDCTASRSSQSPQCSKPHLAPGHISPSQHAMQVGAFNGAVLCHGARGQHGTTGINMAEEHSSCYTDQFSNSCDSRPPDVLRDADLASECRSDDHDLTLRPQPALSYSVAC
ncbi:unnamed protein product [Arctogadus glacialis]